MIEGSDSTAEDGTVRGHWTGRAELTIGNGLSLLSGLDQKRPYVMWGGVCGGLTLERLRIFFCGFAPRKVPRLDRRDL